MKPSIQFGKPVRTIIVGVGRMGKNHLRVTQESSQFSLVAIVDGDAEKRKALTGAFEKFSDLDECLAKVEFDVAIVAASTQFHFELAKKLLAAGKHVLLEKPIATNYDDALELVKISEANKVVFKVGHLERLNPAVRKLKEVINAGWIGNPIHFSFTRVGGYPSAVTQGNNVLLDLAVHDIDVLHFLVGTQNPFAIRGVAAHSTWQPGVLDTAEVLLGNEAATSASIHVNWITPTKIRNLRITGTRGVCVVDYILQTCALFGGNLLQSRQEPDLAFADLVQHYQNTDRIEFGVDREEPLKVQLKEFHKSLMGEPSEVCDALEAALAVDLAHRALKTQAENENWTTHKKAA
jgi:UDP-N-acetylglucosamine 3-dehydrogenase